MEKQFPICHQISLHLIINILKDISTAVLGQKFAACPRQEHHYNALLRVIFTDCLQHQPVMKHRNGLLKHGIIHRIRLRCTVGAVLTVHAAHRVVLILLKVHHHKNLLLIVPYLVVYFAATFPAAG